MEQEYTESNCCFEYKYTTLKLDDLLEDLKLNNIYKAVDFIILKEKKTFFIEVKSYDTFQKNVIDENITKIIKKLSDSYFILNFLNNEQISKFNKNLKGKLTLVILICPIQNIEITPDRLVILEEILKRFQKKISLLNVEIILDTEKNKHKFFKNISHIKK